MSEIFELAIIGMGPAGIGVAMSLCGTSKIKNTICFERGSHVSNINCPALSQDKCCYSNTCSVISGIGGASVLNSGKISDYPAGSGLAYFFDSEQQLRGQLSQTIRMLIDKVGLRKIEIDTEIANRAKLFYEKKNINYKYYDVYEFDGRNYQSFIQETVQELRNNGLRLFDNAEVIDISRNPHTSCFSIKVNMRNDEQLFFARNLVLATGALDIQDELVEKVVGLTTNCVEIGTRIEVPSEAFENILSAHGDLKLKFGSGRTYCVTAHGKIISYRTGGMFFLEGCVDPFISTNYTNLAILIKRNDDEAISDFISRYHEKFSGLPVKQRFVDYIKGQVSSENIDTTLASAVCGDINNLFPSDVNSMIKEFIEDILVAAMTIPEDAITLVAPELKILRNLKIAENFALDNNLFIVGAATGKFRGILQSLCSGIRCGQLLAKG